MLLLFLPISTGGRSFIRSGIELPDIENYKGIGVVLPNVSIDRQGKIFLGSGVVEDLSALPQALEDSIGMWRVYKIILIVDKNTDFGTVQFVLKAARKAGVEEVSLVTHGIAYVIDYALREK
jgi:biopolymer transport protein ExbD